jgi:hypothetical protein
VLNSLDEAVNEDMSLVVPVCEAIEKLPLTSEQRRGAVDSMLQRVNTVAAEDVPDLVFFVLCTCASGSHALRACQVCAVCLLCGGRSIVYMMETSPALHTMIVNQGFPWILAWQEIIACFGAYCMPP